MAVIGPQWLTTLRLVVAFSPALVFTSSIGKYDPCSAPGLATSVRAGTAA